MRKRRILRGTIGVVVVLLVWQAGAMFGGMGAVLPSPIDVGGAIGESFVSRAFQVSLINTNIIALEGLAISIVVGAVLGVIIGSSDVLGHATRVIIEFIKPIPPIVILPLVVVVFGPTELMAITLILFYCVIAILYQTANGVRQTDPTALDTARSYGLSRGETLVRVVVPSAAAFIAMAVRVTTPAALMITVVAGLLGGGIGLGHDIYVASSGGDYATVFGYVVVLGVLGLLYLGASRLVESWVLRWHPAYRGEVAA